jgi:hypothetical protein
MPVIIPDASFQGRKRLRSRPCNASVATLAAMTKTSALLAVAALAVSAVLTGCGGSGGQHTAVPTSTSAGDQVMKFAQCLRQHGINVADPQPGQPPKVDDQGQDRQGLQQANQACRQGVG